MRPAIRLSSARALTLALFALLFALALPAVAHATTFASEVPIGPVHTQPTLIAADAFSPVALDKRYAQIRVDGLAYATSLSNVGTVTGHWTSSEVLDPATGIWTVKWTWVATAADSTRATVYSYPVFATPLSDGVHTVTATLRDISGVTSVDTWTFTLGIAPTLGTPTPAPGSRVPTTTPAITVPVSDNSPTAMSATASVNGAPVPASVSAGLARVTSPVLPNDATATVTLTVTDAAGNATTKSWAFFVEGYPDMFSTIGACTDCHHDDATHSGMVPGLGWTDCQRCHSVYPHPGTPVSIHTRANVTGCSPCHVSDLTVEHARHLTTSGTAITCATCHASGDATVVSAIATGNSACSACHGATSGHESLHVTTVTPACAGAGCHVGTSLTSIHINSGTTLTCDSCHKSTDPAVVAAIAGHDLSCTGCHGSAGHTAVHDTTVSASCAGPACHAGSNLIAIHINSGTTLSCASCHTSSDSKVVAAISGGVTDCSACHDVANAHGDLNAVHTAQVSPGTIVFFDSSSSHAIQRSGEVDLSADCTMCHATTNLLSLHANDCSICHSGSAPPAASFPSWNKTCSQGSCHPTYHDNASSAHDDEASDSCSCHDTGADISTANPAFCGECHALGADTTPPTTTSDALASYVGPVSVTLTATDDRELKATYYRLDGGATSTVSGGTVYVASPASGSQSHTLEYWSVDWSGNMEVPHTALFSVSADTQAPVTSSDAKATYAGPVTINLTATDNATSLGVRATYFRFDTGANQTGTTATLPQPGSGAETHTIHFWSVDYAGNIEAEKSATFTVNADLVAPTTTSNLLPAPKYYPGAGSPGKIVISLYPTDPSPSSGIAGIYVDSTNPNTWWGDNHQAGWNAAAGAYQLGMWVFASGDYPVTWYATDNAGNVESPKTTIIKVDADRPVTTSNAISQHTYVGDQTFTLSATDTGGSGLANTYWRLDGGPLTTGTVIPVPAPASGTVSHTINYYSTDNAGNQELGLAYTMFYVQAGPDTIPPTGAVTINAGAAWTNTTAASIVASATDNIGVSQMRFSNDTVTWSAWETYSVIAKSWTLASGNGTKTVYAQYKDAAGNVSATATDTIGLDGTAPVTSSDATPGQTYIGAKTFTLTPADTGGSGVASTFWQLDSTSGAWTAGTSVPVAAPSSGTVSHTLYWYSTDAAGNRESNKSVTFNVSAPPPDTIAPTGSLRINSGAAWTATTTVSIVASATDNVAVAQMRFSNDTVTWSAWETYSTAAKSWILASGNGTKSVYAQYKDAAGNVSATATSTIGLDTIAPVTTAVINAPANGAGTVTLNVSESGSGVQSTKYILTTGGVAGAQQSYAGAIPLAAPVSGSTVYSVEYWSVDNATNTESPHKFTGTIMINAPAAISTLSATLTSGSLHAFKHFVFYDEHGTSIGDSGWMTDDHTGSYSLQVPSGHAYTMFVEWWIPAYDNNGTDSDTFSDSRAVTAAEAQPGATVSWTVNY